MNADRINADELAFNNAIFSRDFNIAATLLSKIDIETQDYNDYTYLLKACASNDVKVFEWLIQHGANIDAQDKSLRNAMFVAIETVSMDIIQWLADDKRLLCTTYRGKNPLHEAVLANKLDMVKLLVTAGLNPDEQTPNGSSAFDFAQAQDDTTIMKWLLTNKSFNILDQPHDEKTKVATLEILFDKYGHQLLNVKSGEKNLTIGDYAADMNLIEVLRWWKSKNVPLGKTSARTDKAIARDFDDALFSHNFDTALELLLKVNIETRDNCGNTYLMKACASNDIEAFKWLIQSGASIDVQHKSGRNVIFLAIDNHSLDIMKWLVTNEKLLSTTYKGQNPLHEAILVNALDMVKLLIAAGVNPDLKNHRGATAFDIAQEQSDGEILEWLLMNRSFEILEEAQCDETKIAALENLFTPYGYQYLNIKSTEKNSTIAEYAAQMEQIQILLWLKSKNIPVDESIFHDIEAFRKALSNDDFNIATDLLSKVNIETRYHGGNTCLMEACTKNNVKVFEWLIHHGANINVQDKSGKNLIFLAINSKSLDIVKWLTDKPILHTIYNGHNPLHEAILVNQIDMVKLLVDTGLDPDIPNESNANAFDMAYENSDKSILEWLLTYRSFKIMHAAQSEETRISNLENLFDKYGYQYVNLRSVERNLTIAEYAAKMQEIEVLEWLKSKKVPVHDTLLFATAPTIHEEAFDKALFNHRLGQNAMFLTIPSDRLDIVRWLADKKLLLDTTYAGRYPLQEAILFNKLDVVKLLVVAGVDPDTKTKFGVNAFELAYIQADKAILTWLLTNRSFQILDEAQDEEAKVTALKALFDRYGYHYLNRTSVERNVTIATYAAKTQQIEVLKWLDSKNISVDKMLLDVTANTNTTTIQFSDALFKHKFDIASELLPKVDIESRDCNGNTYLVTACLKNDSDAFHWLVRTDADICVLDKSGRNLILIAMEHRSLDIITWFAENQRFINIIYNYQYPLHQAILSNQLDLVRLMIAAGFCPYDRNQFGDSAFDVAQDQVDNTILEWLLFYVSFEILDVKVETSTISILKRLFPRYGYQYLNIKFTERNLTIAEYAAKMKQIEVLRWLKSKNIPVDETLLCDTDTKVFEKALCGHNFDVAVKLLRKINIETQDYYGDTYLMKACVNKDLEVFDWLIKSNARIDVQDKSGKNLLFMAIEARSVDIVKRLADDKRLLYTIYKGQTALHKAVLVNHLVMVKLLVAAGLNPNVKGESKVNAFDIAQTQTDKIVLKWLLLNKSFEILDADRHEQNKIATLKGLFSKYGDEYLNVVFADRNLTIPEYAANTEQFDVLKWLKSKNVKMPETIMQETVSPNETYRQISSLGMVLAETTRCIEMNRRRNNRYLKEQKDVWDTFTKSIFVVPTIDLKVRPLHSSVTVCTNQKCAKISRIEGILEKNFTKFCHSPCYLKGVSKEVIGDPVLSRCYPMEDKNGTRVCRRDSCGHDFKEHMHVDYIIEAQDEDAPRTVNNNILTLTRWGFLKPNARISGYENEIHVIQNCMAMFAYFLKNNSVEGFSDPYRKYMESLIDSERKMADVDNRDVIKRYEELISAYECGKNDFEASVAEIGETTKKAIISGEFLTSNLEMLYNLPHTGKTIKDLHTNSWFY